MRPQASLSGGGEKPKKQGEKATKAHKQLKQIMSGLGVTFRSLGAIIAITLLGNVVFSALEVDLVWFCALLLTLFAHVCSRFAHLSLTFRSLSGDRKTRAAPITRRT